VLGFTRPPLTSSSMEMQHVGAEDSTWCSGSRSATGICGVERAARMIHALTGDVNSCFAYPHVPCAPARPSGSRAAACDSTCPRPCLSRTRCPRGRALWTEGKESNCESATHITSSQAALSPTHPRAPLAQHLACGGAGADPRSLAVH